MSKYGAITVIVAIVMGAAGFYGGMVYQKSQAMSGFAARRTSMGTGNAPAGSTSNKNGTTQGMRNGFRPVSGEITSVDKNSITVSLSDGSSKIVLFSESTSINKAEKATNADLKVGEKVSVFGTQNTEGTVTAQNIQLNPVQMNPPAGEESTPISPPPAE